MDYIQSAAQSIIQTRDFCGDEMAALIEWERENQKLTPAEHKLVSEKVAEIWRKSQQAAKA